MNYVINKGELYHYGVPGMKWGHKRGPKSPSKSNQTKTKKELTPEQKQARNKKIAAGVLAGVGAATVAAVAVYATKQRQRAVRNTMIRMMQNTKPKNRAHLPYYGRQWNLIQKEMAKARRNQHWTQ